MQTWPGDNQRGSGRRRFGKITLYTLLCFSLAGLIAGFAFGGSAGQKTSPKTTNTGPVIKPTQVVQSAVTVTPTTQPIVQLNPPQTLSFAASTQKADGATMYSITIQAIDTNKVPIHSPDITCKLWLVKRIPDGQIMEIDSKTLKDINNLAASIRGTNNKTHKSIPEVSGLSFTAAPQTTHCNAKGQVTWQYTIAPTVPPGAYDLVILTDWKGVHYNWSWDHITIQ